MHKSEAEFDPAGEIDEGGWQLMGGFVVLLGCLASLSYPILATVWG